MEHQVASTDIVVVYSDGLDDNLHEDDMKLCMEPYIKDGVLGSLG